MTELGFSVLYESHACLVVSKPPGLSTQAPPGIDSLEVRIKRFLRHRDNEPGDLYLGVPHRLDRPASGAMVFAKTRRATRKLAQQFQRRLVRKVYWACVAGQVAPAAGTWRGHPPHVPRGARAGGGRPHPPPPTP